MQRSFNAGAAERGPRRLCQGAGCVLVHTLPEQAQPAKQWRDLVRAPRPRTKGVPNLSTARHRSSSRLPRSSQYSEKRHPGASQPLETASKAGTTIDTWDRSKHSIKLGLQKLRVAKTAGAPGARCRVRNGIYADFDKPLKNQAPSQLICQPAEIAGHSV